MGDFHGLATGSLENEHLRLEYLLGAGPRLVRLFLSGSGENLLAEAPEMHWETPHGRYYLRGGHRLWHAPEAADRTYVPDDQGLQVEALPGGVRLSRPPEAPTGIAKSIEARLHADRPGLTLVHRLQNCGAWAVELAPWAITQLPLGGWALLPQAQGPADRDGLQPNRRLALWPYTRLSDPRLRLDDDLLLVRASPDPQPLKLGLFTPPGWLAYLRAGMLFIKRFSALEWKTYPDMGCNAEVYCRDRFIELESLGPLERLEPGETAEHIETWEIQRLEGEHQTAEQVRSLPGAVHWLG